VHPELAGHGHERELLKHVLETLLGTPGLRRIEAQLPHYQRGDLESCFLSRSFKSYLRRFMSLSLASRPEAAEPQGLNAWVWQNIQLIPWEKSCNKDAAELVYQCYRQHVDAAINDQYASAAGTARLIENIVQNQGCGDFLAHISRMAFDGPTQELAGILTVTRVRPHTAHIPQVAVSPAFQGLGVGTALMEAAFQDLEQEGFEEVTLTVTDANAGAVRLYLRLGFETFQAFGAFIFDQASGVRYQV
jgi:ribosomal protein S18 acetylase RimI-like enzyme